MFKSWNELFESIDNGTYSERFHIGDVFPLDLVEEGNVNARLVAFNYGESAKYIPDWGDVKFRPSVTFVIDRPLNKKHPMNEELDIGVDDTGVSGTGSLGGFYYTELRYELDLLEEKFPEEVRNRFALQLGDELYHRKIGEEIYISPKLRNLFWVPTRNECLELGINPTVCGIWLRDCGSTPADFQVMMGDGTVVDRVAQDTETDTIFCFSVD